MSETLVKITEEWLKEKNACLDGVKWFSHSSQSDPLAVLKLLISEDRLDWANWLIVRVMKRPQYLAYAIYAAEKVIGIFEKKYPKDKRPREAIEAAKKVLDHDIAKNRKAATAAYAAAAAAADAAYAAYAAAADAADAADATYAAAAADAAYAAYAAYYAAYAAYAADAAAAAADARAKLKLEILEYGIKLLEESVQCLKP